MELDPNKKYQLVPYKDWAEKNPFTPVGEVHHAAVGNEHYVLLAVEEVDKWISVDKINVVIKELELSLEPEAEVIENPQKYNQWDVSQARLIHSSIKSCIGIIRKILPPSAPKQDKQK